MAVDESRSDPNRHPIVAVDIAGRSWCQIGDAVCVGEVIEIGLLGEGDGGEK
jgi:hypothetical protein